MKPSPSRRDTEKDALEYEFLEGYKKSGTLEIDGKTYIKALIFKIFFLSGEKQVVDPNEIHIISLLGSGSCGVVESATVRSKLMAVKVSITPHTEAVMYGWDTHPDHFE